MESNPGPQSIRETLNWYRETLQNGKCSEAKIKSESLTFFDLSSANQMKDKKLFKKSLEGLVKAHTKTQKNILREEMKLSAKYLSWIDKDFQLFNESKKVTPSKIEQKVGETIKLTRESGPNIHDASKTTYTKQRDGTLVKTVLKQTYANITIREACKTNFR